jgi:Flp pilus assembly protein TadD/transglutaminase-like putative cysteine protease
MRIFRLARLAFFFLIISSAVYAQNTAAPKPFAKSDEKPAAKPPDYSQEAFVVEKIRTAYRFENDGTGTREIYAKIKVQSEAGVNRWGQVVVGYNSANEKVEIPYVRVLKADGSSVTAPPGAVQDLTPPFERVAPVYTDYRQKQVTVPGLRPGEELEYDIVTVTQTPLAQGQFWMEHSFDKDDIVLDEQLELNIPVDRKVELKNKPGIEPKVTDENGRRTYLWTSSHLVREDDDSSKKKDKKPKKSKEEAEMPDVQLTTFSNWAELGNWYGSLEKDRRQPTAEIRTQEALLTEGKTTDLEKIQALYHYVATNFHYISLSFGVGRFQPHAATDVLHNQYGDCKDKHTLLASLLEAAGYHPASVLINSSRKLDPDVPSPSQFDHVITMVPLGKEEIWMDSTTEVAPFRLLSFNIRKKQALVIPEDGTPHLEETPADPPEPDHDMQDIDATVSDSGKLEATVHYVARGDMELLMRTVFRQVPSVEWKHLAQMISASGGLTGDIQEIHADDPAATSKPFEMSYKIEDDSFLDWTKKEIDLHLPLTGMNLPTVDDDPGPDPIKLGPPAEHVYRLRMELPKKYKIQIPLSFSVKRDYAEYEATYHLDGNVFTAERKLTIKTAEIPPDRASDYQSFQKTLTADLGQQLALESTVAGNAEPPDMTADELAESGSSAIENQNYKLAIELLKRAVAADPKHKYAWNNLGRAYMADGQLDQAIAAYQKQIEVNPYDEYAYNNLGRVYWIQRNYEQAAEAFNKQIGVNPLDQFAHANLGGVYLDWKKYSDAVPELEKAVSIQQQNPELQVQLGTAYLNVGDPDKAQSAFEKAVQLSPTPVIWNNIAYQLSLKKVHLDLAQQYAESAVAATTAASRNLTLEKPDMRDMAVSYSLSAYWDTLGWVYFVDGQNDKAEKYIRAAWLLSGRSEIGDHLGQVYEKMGRKEDAIRMYAMATKASRPVPDAAEHLSALVGGGKISSVADKYVTAFQDLRTLEVGKAGKLTGSADFLVVLGNEDSGGAEDAKFISGDDGLKNFAETLRNEKFAAYFPDNLPTKVLRRGTLSCSSLTGKCIFVLILPDDVHSID